LAPDPQHCTLELVGATEFYKQMNSLTATWEADLTRGGSFQERKKRSGAERRKYTTTEQKVRDVRGALPSSEATTGG